MLVRTPNFKKWFGDWETAAIIQEIENMPAKDVKPHEALDKAGIKDVFRSFGEVKNKRDGRKVVFPTASAGKILRHKGFPTNTIIRNFKELFEDSISAYSTNVEQRENHKMHLNFEKYHNYVSKLKIGNSEFFIRFTVIEEKHNERNAVHSSFVSNIDLYKKEELPKSTPGYNLGEKESSSKERGSTLYPLNTAGSSSSLFIDDKLADFLNSVKPESVSKVVDENGEPLVVYHRSQDSFNVFDRGKIGSASDWGALGRGFYFSPRDMIQYGGVKYSVFLNIKNPMILDRDNVGAIRDEVDADRGESFTKRIVEQGYDGVIYKDWEGIDEIVALESPQIKKAANRQELDFGKGMLDVPDTDNVGTFDGGNPDIRFSMAGDAKPVEIRKPDEVEPAFRKTLVSIVNTIEKIKNSGEKTDSNSILKKYDKRKRIKIARLNKKQQEYLKTKDEYVYTTEADIIDHHFNHHPELDPKRYYNLPETIFDADVVAKGSVDLSFTFGKMFDKLHIATNQVNIKDGRVFLYKNLFLTNKKNFFKNKEIIKELSPRVVRQPTTKADSYEPPPATEIISGSQGDNSVSKTSSKDGGSQVNFSFADSHIEAKKRLAAILLAKKLYADAGRDYDAESGRPVEIKAKEADRDFVYMQDMAFLDEDVDWIVARAEAVAYRLANSYDKKAVGDAELERRAKAEERSFQNSHIVEACVRDALEKREKALNVRERLKAKEKREAQKERGFSVDELLIAGIEIDAAIFDAAEGSGALDAVDAEVDKAFEFVQNRATDKGLDIDSDGYVAMLSKTMANSLRSAALELPYGRNRAAAMKGIAGLSGIAAGETIARRAKKLGRKLAEYLKRDAQRLSDAEEAAFMKEYSRAKKEAERKRKSEEEFSKLRQKMRDLKREHRRRRMLAEIEGRLKKYSKKPTRAHASKRKINALVEWYLAAAKSYIELTPEELSEEKRKLEGKSFDYEYDAAYNRIEIEALSMFGALKYSDIARVASALDYLRGVVLRGKVEHMQKVLEFQEAAARDAKTLAAGLAARGKNVAGKGGSMLAQSAGEGSSVFRHTLENVFLNNLKDGSAEKAEVSVLSNELATNVSRFALEERRLQTEDMEWLHKAGIEIYGSENAMSRELLEHKDEYRKYSTHGGLVSKANLLAWVAMLEQESMQTARRIMDSEVWEDEEGGGGKEKIRDGAGRALYMRFENLEAMKAELSDRDMEFLDAIKKRWSDRFPKISQVIGELTGAPLQSVSADYFPIVREGDIELTRISGAKSKIPGYIIPRTVSFKDIDDDADIFSIFSKRAQEDAHLLAYRDFGFRIDAIFKAKPIQDAMKQYMTNIERDEFVRFVDQSVNGKEYFAQTAESKLLSAITSVTAFTGLGWNPVSAIKQLTGAVSFGLEVGAVQNIKDIVWAVGTPEGRRALMEVFNSEYMRVRRGGALNPGLEHAMREFGEGKYGNGMSAVKRLIAKTRPFVMTAGMDSVASSLGGAAIYMRFLEAHSVSHDMDEARRLAMLDFMEIVERTQQSSLTHNQSSFLRNHGFIGRAVMQFKSNPQLFFSYEVKAVREWWNDRGNIEKFKRLCSVIAINHFIIPASFNGMGVLLSFLMGDDWDDEDLKFFMMSTATDVLSGWWLGGIIKGIAATAAGMNNRDLTSEILPAAGLARIGNQVGLILRDFTRGEFGDNYEKRLKNLFKAAFPPGRYALKIYDNATDNKEGVFW